MDLATFVPVSSADSFTVTMPTGFLMAAAARLSDSVRNSSSNAHCLFAIDSELRRGHHGLVLDCVHRLPGYRLYLLDLVL